MILANFSMTTVFAFEKIDTSDNVLAEMRSNPKNFIRYGGQSIGLTFFLAKNSVNVVKYNLPQYIIAVRK